MRNIKSFIIIITSVVLSFLIYFAANWISNQITDAFAGDPVKFFQVGFGLFGIGTTLITVVVFIFAQVVGALINIIRAGSKLIAILALILSIALPVGTGFFGLQLIQTTTTDSYNQAKAAQIDKFHKSGIESNPVFKIIFKNK